MKTLSSLFLALTIPLHGFSQGIKIDDKLPLSLWYRSVSWNKSTTERDSSSLLIRDRNSGRLVHVQLQETDVNSNEFKGTYVLSFNSDQFLAEVYILPRSAVDKKDTWSHLISENRIARKPVFYKKEKNTQTLEIYDTLAQAQAAAADWKKIRLAGINPRGLSPNITPDPSILEAQRQAAFEAEKKKLEDLARLQELERKKLAEEEALRIEKLRQQQSQLAQAQKDRRRQKAQSLSVQGMKAYSAENYIEAERLFGQSVDLDPSQTEFYFQYGISLYRNENFNRSLVVLKAVPDQSEHRVERDYFIALNLLKLRELKSAQQNFLKVKDQKHPQLSPASAFFAGVIDFELENFAAAKANFEFVLDESQDPALDQQSESYLEQIANILNFQSEQKKKFIFSGQLGLSYDSNILQVASTSSANDTQTGLAGFRWNYGASLEWRPLFKVDKEFTPSFAVSDMYSTDQSFQGVAEFQNVDPQVWSLTLPYKWKGLFQGLPTLLGFSLLSESIFMNSDGTGEREQIVSTLGLKTDFTQISSESRIQVYSLELRSDNSKIESGADDDLSSNRLTLATVQTYFKNPKKTEALIVDGSVSLNQAEGKNATYTRVELGLGYTLPWKLDLNLLGRLGLYRADYSESTAGRADTNLNLSLNASRPLTEKISLTLGASFIQNSSSIEDSSYNKYLISTMLSWTDSLGH
jgi:hypothetical protein